MSLMTYDLHGSWEPYTGHHTALYPRAAETGDDRYLNVVQWFFFNNFPRSGEPRTQKLKSHLVRTQSLNVLPLKHGVDQYEAIRATLTSLLISTLPVHSPAFFPKHLPISPELAVANTWFP